VQLFEIGIDRGPRGHGFERRFDPPLPEGGKPLVVRLLGLRGIAHQGLGMPEQLGAEAAPPAGHELVLIPEAVELPDRIRDLVPGVAILRLQLGIGSNHGAHRLFGFRA